MEEQKIDVVINVYGKPYQTLCTLKSLMLHSGKHIDKIYLIEELQQPYGENIDFILNEFDNLIHFKPNKYCFTPWIGSFGDLNDQENRYCFRYQYGIEKSDKKYVFITHNDILYTGDIIGDMLSSVEGSAGIGLIGQCWNCPAFKGGLCDGSRYQDYKPTYQDIISVSNQHTPARYTQFTHLINRDVPMPLPECRLNEFACLVDRDVCINECPPNGNSRFFGGYDILDLGDAWFRDLVLKGYQFKNYDINKTSIHGYYSQLDSEVRVYEKNDRESAYGESKFFVSGYPTQLDHYKYVKAEELAKEYFENNFKK